MTPERSNPLHNFKLPSRLRWGTQRYLRCKKPDDPQQPNRSDRVHRSDEGSQIEAIGERLMLDFKLKMDNLKVVVGGGGDEERNKEKAVEECRPWNLRARRLPAPVPEVVEKRKVVGERSSPVPEVVEKRKVVGERSSPVKRVRGGIEEKVRFRVALKREEVEDDFLMMIGIKPPRRPKKRPRAFQKELETLFPGFWLTEVTPERYDVPEAPES